MVVNCKHQSADHLMPGDVWHGEVNQIATVEHFRCCDCGAYLSLGPAIDTPEVRIEIRAAELSDLATSHATPLESQGWFDYALDRDCVSVLRDEWNAGWLGRAIHEHGRESMREAMNADPLVWRIVRHNHPTRDIKARGKCPACDRYHASCDAKNAAKELSA